MEKDQEHRGHRRRRMRRLESEKLEEGSWEGREEKGKRSEGGKWKKRLEGEMTIRTDCDEDGNWGAEHIWKILEESFGRTFSGKFETGYGKGRKGV